MPIDPSIPLSVRPFQAPQFPNYIDQYSKITNIRNAQAETDLRKQEADQNVKKAQREQQQFDQGQRQLDAEKTEGELIAANTQTGSDGSTQVNHQAVVQGLAQKGFGQQASTYKTRVQIPDEKAQIENQKNKLDNGIKQLGIISNSAASVSRVDDLNIADAYDKEIQGLEKQGIIQIGSQPTSEQLISQGGIPALRQHIQQQALQSTNAKDQSEIHQKDLDFSQKQLDFKQKVETQAPKTAQEWTKNASQLLSAAQTPQQWAAGLKTLLTQGAPTSLVMQFPQQFSPEAVKQASQMGMTPAERETARHNAAEEAQGAARVADEQQKTGIASKTFDATYGSGANPALVGVEPKLRTAAMRDAQKAADEFSTANKAADAMQSMIDMARKGNKAAGSNLPLVGVETLNALNGIKRMNKSELDQYQGAGSILDRIQGKIGSLAVGQPIPADVMKDIQEMHETLRSVASKAYSNKLAGINQNYRSNFQGINGSGPSSTDSWVTSPKTQGEYNALPKGAKFKKPNDETVYTKQ